ncbi:hypothetical protein HMPREF3167_02470 [Trueperella sp. HMSC08B05]|uniref:hypothetical protein n=1 Tax=Trueperella TaxID=1069494 RepID=UPI0008A100DD|nr:MULTISPECIES: hypothetical protein [Trueperella]MDV6238659.1 hypothetical protein [Trueperella bernardiae]OFS75703.1 hypothetical protein HMPREF3167_02470 [Trueperella sp. HMSC08B05]
MAELINAFGGLAGLAALVTAFAGFRNVKRDTVQISAGPGSLTHKIDELARQVDHLTRASATTHDLLSKRLDGHDREFRDLRRRRRN